jgi:hypothetical protein
VQRLTSAECTGTPKGDVSSHRGTARLFDECIWMPQTRVPSVPPPSLGRAANEVRRRHQPAAGALYDLGPDVGQAALLAEPGDVQFRRLPAAADDAAAVTAARVCLRTLRTFAMLFAYAKRCNELLARGATSPHGDGLPAPNGPARPGQNLLARTHDAYGKARAAQVGTWGSIGAEVCLEVRSETAGFSARLIIRTDVHVTAIASAQLRCDTEVVSKHLRPGSSVLREG